MARANFKSVNMTSDKEIFKEIRRLRAEYGAALKYNEVPASIKYIKELIAQNPQLFDDQRSKKFLHPEYIYYEMNDEYLSSLYESINKHPDEPERKIPLAHHLARMSRAKEAIDLFKEILEEAEKKKTMVGFCYNELARLADVLKNGNVLNHALKFLAKHDFYSDDCTLPYDLRFLENLPKDVVDPDLLKTVLDKVEAYNKRFS